MDCGRAGEPGVTGVGRHQPDRGSDVRQQLMGAGRVELEQAAVREDGIQHLFPDQAEEACRVDPPTGTIPTCPDGVKASAAERTPLIS